MLIWTIFDKSTKDKILTMTISLGQYLRELRIGKGKTLHEVSKGVDIDSPLLSKIERSERLPTLLQVKKLSRFYEVA